MNKQFTDKMQMANKQVKRLANLLKIKELQINSGPKGSRKVVMGWQDRWWFYLPTVKLCF